MVATGALRPPRPRGNANNIIIVKNDVNGSKVLDLYSVFGGKVQGFKEVTDKVLLNISSCICLRRNLFIYF